jgi:tetratricopeptide (TPR) repeat protein
VKIWDLATGRETRSLLGRGDEVWATAFSPNGNLLASLGEKSDIVELWEAASPREIKVLDTEERTIVARRTAARSRVPRAPATLAWQRREARELLMRRQWAAALQHLDPLARAGGWRDHLERGRALAWLNRWREAERAFARAVALARSDPDVWLARGSVYAELWRWERAAADMTRAIDLGRSDPMVWYRRALTALGGSGDDRYSRIRARLLTRVLARKPREAEAWLERGYTHGDLRQWRQAVADFTRAVALKPANADAWIGRGRSHAELGEWKQAADDLALGLQKGVGSDEWWRWYELALARLGSGNLQGYRQACAEMLTRFGQTEDDWIAWNIASACALAPGAAGGSTRPLELAQRCVSRDTGAFSPDWQLRTTLALALYRADKFDQAIARAKESMAASPYGDHGVNWLLRAMAHHRLGQGEEAHRWLQKGRRWRVAADPNWQYRLRYQLLRREAEQLIAGGGVAVR